MVCGVMSNMIRKHDDRDPSLNPFPLTLLDTSARGHMRYDHPSNARTDVTLEVGPLVHYILYSSRRSSGMGTTLCLPNDYFQDHLEVQQNIPFQVSVCIDSVS